jgi:hypothetical protein
MEMKIIEIPNTTFIVKLLAKSTADAMPVKIVATVRGCALL